MSDDGDIFDLKFEAGDGLPLIPAGEYEARVRGGRTQKMVFKGQASLRLRMEFVITAGHDASVYSGEILPFHATLPRDNRGLNPRSKFGRAWIVANGAPPKRGQRTSLEVFKNRLFRVRVRTVTHDRFKRPLPEAVHYSVVGEILGRLA